MFRSYAQVLAQQMRLLASRFSARNESDWKYFNVIWYSRVPLKSCRYNPIFVIKTGQWQISIHRCGSAIVMRTSLAQLTKYFVQNTFSINLTAQHTRFHVLLSHNSRTARLNFHLFLLRCKSLLVCPACFGLMKVKNSQTAYPDAIAQLTRSNYYRLDTFRSLLKPKLAE